MGNSNSTESRPKKPNLLQRIQIAFCQAVSLESWLPLGMLCLVIRRSLMQSLNLLPAPDAPVAGRSVPLVPYRRPDASGTDANNLKTGASGTPFARNMMPNPKPDPDGSPSVQLVARKLLARTSFKPAGDQLNVLAAAWIQFMSHDWMRGRQTQEDVTLDDGGPKCPLRSFTFHKTAKTAKNTVINERTHWWDTSVVYGSDRDTVSSIREFKGGRLIMGTERGVLPRYPDGTLRVGDNMNSYAGVMLLQELFMREHNAVCAFIAREHPHLADDDEALFNLGHLVVSAIAAKIHTVDWTTELLKTKLLDIGMNTNWYGVLRGLNLPCFRNSNPPGPLSLVGKKSETHGVPFALTEEFVTVYRLHPLLPDGLPLRDGWVPLEGLLGKNGENHLCTEERAVDTWTGLIKYPCGNLQLFNYPRALRALTPTTPEGNPIERPVDLAALDLYRDRERGIRNYNDFRRALFMNPVKDYKELTDDVEAQRVLEEVYGPCPQGIEKVDLLIGNLAEKKIPGFAISETQFNIFLLMASRRLESDRFLNEDFNEKTYTRAGLAWVHGTRNMRDVLARHYPEMTRLFPNRQHSAFKPTTEWPEQFLKPDAAVEAIESAEPIA